MLCKKMLLGGVVSFMLLACSQMFASCGRLETNHDSEQKPNEIETEDASKDKYVILLVAGQSNAVGYDESKVTAEDIAMESEKICQLGYNGNENLKIIPLGHCAQSFQNLSTPEFTNLENVKDPYGEFGPKTIHLPLAGLLMESGIIPGGYKLLVIPAAYGNTGFLKADGSYDFEKMVPSYVASGGWRTSGAQYLAMRDRLKYVLDLNLANKYLGCVWIQGEADAPDPQTHFAQFKNMVETFNSFFSEYDDRTLDGKGFSNDIWWNVRSTCYWTGEFSDTKGAPNSNRFANASGYNAILNNYELWNPGTFVTFDSNEMDTNYVSPGTPGSTRVSSIFCSHFGNSAYRTKVAPAILLKIKEHFAH